MKYSTKPENGMLRIIALKDFNLVKKGDFGGLIGAEKNLNQDGNAWVYGNAQVSDDAQVYGNARVSDDAQVSGDADMLLIGLLGSRSAYTTFFCEKNRIAVCCGCFYGSIDDFEIKVKSTYPTDQYGVEYMAAIAAAKIILKIKG